MSTHPELYEEALRQEEEEALMSTNQFRVREQFTSFIINSTNLITNIGRTQESIFAAIEENNLGAHREALFQINALERGVKEYFDACNRYGKTIDTRFREISGKLDV